MAGLNGTVNGTVPPNPFTPTPPITFSTGSGLPGVILINSFDFGVNSSLLGLNQYKEDLGDDVFNYIGLGLPFLLLWIASLVFISRYTDDTGFVFGVRHISSKYRPLTIVTGLLIVYEALQLAAVPYGQATTASLQSGARYLKLSPAIGIPRDQAHFLPLFGFACAVWAILFIVIAIPQCIHIFVGEYYYVYDNFLKEHENLAQVIGLLHDTYLIYMPLPLLCMMLSGLPCVHYSSGEPSEMDFWRLRQCGSTAHINHSVVGGLFSVLYFLSGILFCSNHIVVRKTSDHSINARFVALQFGIKSALSVVYVLFQARHRWAHAALTFVFQGSLIFFAVSLRPTLLERINYFRCGAYCFAMVSSLVVFVGNGIDDDLSPLPGAYAGFGYLVVAVGLLLKYFVGKCSRSLPPAKFEGGAYEGGICLGLNVRHGLGIQTWQNKFDDVTKQYIGGFLFGMYHGHGVLTEDDLFYRGDWRWGKKHGFGKTNMVGRNLRFLERMREQADNVADDDFDVTWKTKNLAVDDTMVIVMEKIDSSTGKEEIVQPDWNPNEDSGDLDSVLYEGYWRDGKPHGLGVKRFLDGDVVDCVFVDGRECGEGTWTVKWKTAGGLEAVGIIHGTWKGGRFMSAEVPETSIYDGPVRYGVPHGQGRMTLISGDEYEGYFYCGRRRGYGIMNYDHDNSNYTGYWLNDRYDGDGTLRSDNGNVYSGSWSKGLKSGYGVLEDEHGKYEGNWDYDEQTGYGVMTYKNGDVYKGSWRHKVREGMGLFVGEDGEYDGTWLGDKKHGPMGRMDFRDGTIYTGGWKEDLRHGFGKETVPNYGEYEGYYASNRRHGHGTFVFSDRSVYDGDWTEGLPNGKGKLVLKKIATLSTMKKMELETTTQKPSTNDQFWEKGGEYYGDFVVGVMEGEGTGTLPDGSRYEGQWERNVPHGTGTMIFMGRGEYVGEFQNGERHGKGIMTSLDEQVYEGEWSAGKKHGKGTTTKKDREGKTITVQGEFFGGIARGSEAIDFAEVGISLQPSESTAAAAAVVEGEEPGSPSLSLQPVDFAELKLDLLGAPTVEVEMNEEKAREAVVRGYEKEVERLTGAISNTPYAESDASSNKSEPAAMVMVKDTGLSDDEAPAPQPPANDDDDW